jgi:hypothetical protein
MSTENKGYKFRFESTETEFYEDDEHGHGTSSTRFVTYGDTAEEAIKGHEDMLDEWDNFLEKKS